MAITFNKELTAEIHSVCLKHSKNGATGEDIFCALASEVLSIAGAMNKSDGKGLQSEDILYCREKFTSFLNEIAKHKRNYHD